MWNLHYCLSLRLTLPLVQLDVLGILLRRIVRTCIEIFCLGVSSITQSTFHKPIFRVRSKSTNRSKGGDNNCTLTGSGTIDTGCGIYTFQLTNANSNNVNTSSVSNASSVSSKSGSGKASGVSYCMVTGSVLLGVAAFFGWFL